MDYQREEENLTGEDSESLTAVILVKLEDPQFEGQTKNKLVTLNQRYVEQVMSEYFSYYLDEHPSIARKNNWKALLLREP